MRRSLMVNGQRSVLRVGCIHTMRHFPQTFAQLRHKTCRCGGELERLAIGREARHALVPRQKLLPVIGVSLGAFDIHVTTTQTMVEIMEHTDFKLTPIQYRCHVAPGADEGLPADAGEVERNLIGQVVSLGVLEALDEVEGLDQRLILRRRAKGEHVGQTEQLGPIRAIKAPHQGPIIVVVVGRHLLVTFPKGFGSTIVL